MGFVAAAVVVVEQSSTSYSTRQHNRVILVSAHEGVDAPAPVFRVRERSTASLAGMITSASRRITASVAGSVW